jgi:hypothetical protein
MGDRQAASRYSYWPPESSNNRKLAMGVATTSQMLFCNTTFKWFLAKYSIWLCTGFSVAQTTTAAGYSKP